MRARRRKSENTNGPAGSALILTVVLTTLLALVAVLFLMTARIDKLASSAATENELLGLAVESTVARISQFLADDVPGMPGSHNYYDYPDSNNPWLADLEPNTAGGDYRWRQITDLNDVEMHPSRFRDVDAVPLSERAQIVDPASQPLADADGDGVTDARWYRLPGVTSGKGRPIYAAVRIIDNGAMLNLNTALMTPTAGRVDGASQLQIDIAGAIAGASAKTWAQSLYAVRDPGKVVDLPAYENGVVWQYLPLPGGSRYTPFDVSDEMALRYRFLLHHNGSDCRAEQGGYFNDSLTLSKPVDSAGSELRGWASRVAAGAVLDPNYAYRHIVTTYNMDRILTPRPIPTIAGTLANKRVNVNTAGQNEMQQAILAALTDRNPGSTTLENLAAQITANLRDYIDDDNEVSVLPGPVSSSGAMVYGFERPCVYLSEIAYRFAKNPTTGNAAESFAVELYKPFFADGVLKPGEWRLEIRSAGSSLWQPITWSGTRRFHVLSLQNLLAPLPVTFQDPNEASQAARIGFVPNANPIQQSLDPNVATVLQSVTTITLQRRLPSGNWLTVDFKTLPPNFTAAAGDANDPNSANGATRCIQRDVSDGKCILRAWGGASKQNLGNAIGNYTTTNATVLQARPTNLPLVNIGELGMVFAVNAYSGVSETSEPNKVLIDLANPGFTGLFNYLTVMDPSRHGRANDETRIMGRININTAPWPVLAALPWIQYPAQVPVHNFTRAQAIVGYRDTKGAYQSIGDLMQVKTLWDLQTDKSDNTQPSVSGQPDGPDLTPDTVRDDLEERDILFTRLSDLVTVRSDVFTAYILVRIGEKGPQRRMVALLDRSQVSPSHPKVRVAALSAVADPR